MTTKLRSTVFGVASVRVSDGAWNGTNISNVEKLSASTFRITLRDQVSAEGGIACMVPGAWSVVSPGVIEVALDVVRDFSAFILSTVFGNVEIGGGGGPPPPTPTVGFLDLGDVSGNLILDGAEASAWRATLVQDVNVFFLNLTPGETYSVEWVQGPTGYRSVNYPGFTEYPEAVTLQITQYPSATTVANFVARTSTAATVTTSGGVNEEFTAYWVHGNDADGFGMILSGGFSVRADPDSRFQPLIAWLGPCAGGTSGILGIQSAANDHPDISLSFRGATEFGETLFISSQTGIKFDLNTAGGEAGQWSVSCGGDEIRVANASLGFYGGAPVVRPTVAGDTHGDLAALQDVVRSLLAALSSTGLNLCANTTS